MNNEVNCRYFFW